MKLLDDLKDACVECAEYCVDNESSILLKVGMFLVGAAVVGTAAATVKAVREIDEFNADQAELDLVEGEDRNNVPETVKAYAKVSRWYILPAAGLALGLYAIAKSNSLLVEELEETKGELTKMTAYALGLEKFIAAYRKRVIDDQGEEADLYYRTGVRKETVETIEDNGDGKKPKKKKESLYIADDELDPTGFSRFFDETCNGYHEDPEGNKMYIKQMLSVLNNILISRYRPAELGKPAQPGIMWMNEVYDAFGIDRTTRGQNWGYVYDPDDPLHNSLAPITAGIYDVHGPNRRFVNGLEPVCLMDFHPEHLIGNK